MRDAFRSPALHAGVLVWLLALFSWVLLWFFDRTQAVASAATLATFLAAGKVVAITAGLTLDGHPWIVGSAVFLPDLGALLFFYPFTRLGIEHLGRWNKWVGTAVENARARQERQEGMIARHGAWGLFAISLVPVGFYSPLVIAALGHIAGLRARQVLVPVGTAMAIMTSAWVVMLNLTLSQAEKLDRRIPWVLSGTLLLLVLIKTAVKAVWRRTHAERPPRSTLALEDPPPRP